VDASWSEQSERYSAMASATGVSVRLTRLFESDLAETSFVFRRGKMPISELGRVKYHLKLAIKAGKPATLTLVEWEKTIADFDGMCAYCRVRCFELLEHFLPAYLAGTHVKNCLPACITCNTRKRNLTGSALARIFGKETIDRLQQYLESRIEQPETALSLKYIRKYHPRHVKIEDVSREKIKEAPRYRKELRSLDDLVSELGVSKKLLFRYIKSGELKGLKLGREWKFEPSDIDDFLERRRHKSEEELKGNNAA